MKTLKNKLRIGLFLLLCGLFIMPATVTKAEDDIKVEKAETTKKEGEIAYYTNKKTGEKYIASFWEAYRQDNNLKEASAGSRYERAAFQMSDLGRYVGIGTLEGSALGSVVGGVGAIPGAAIGAAVGAATFVIDWAFDKKETHTWTDATGNTFKFQIDSGNEAVYAGDTAVGGCEVLPAKIYRYRECMFCPLFRVIYVAADDITAISVNTLSEGFAVVIGLGLAIWIAVQTLAHVSSITKQDAPKFIDSLIKQSFKFLVAFLLLHFHRQVFDYILLPILNTGLIMGRRFLFSNGDDLCAVIPFDGIDVAAYGQDLYSNLVCYITVIQREIGFMQAIGSSLLCIGGHSMIRLDFADGFQMAVVGFILAVFGFLLSIAFAFYLVDAVVQLGIVGALLPFLIASWPFKSTTKYANTGFQMLLNSAFIFVFMGLVVSVNLKLVGASIDETARTSMVDRLREISSNKVDDSDAKKFNFNEEAFDEKTGALQISRSDKTKVQMGGLSSIYMAINAQNITELKKLTDISGMDFLIMLFCCIFGFKFTQQAQSLADKMASGSVSGIAPSIATMGGSAALGMAKKATQAPREAAERKVKQGIGNAYRGAKSFFSRKKGSSSGTGFGKGKSPTVFSQGGVPKKTGQYGSGESNQPQAPITINQGGTTNNSTPLQPKNLAEKRKMEKRFAREYDKSEAGKFDNVMGRANSEAGASKESIKMLRRIKAKSREAYVKARMEGKSQNEAFNAANTATIQAAAADIQEMTGTNVMEMIEGAQKKPTAPKKLNNNNGSRKGNTRVSRKSRKHGGRRK